MGALAFSLSALAVVGIGYLVVAAVFVTRLAGSRRCATGGFPSVTVLKPLHGDEPGLSENLSSFLLQDYPAPVQFVFGVQSPTDPAIAIVRALQSSYPDRDIVLVVDARQHGANRKVSNLINMMAEARHDVLVLSDSDIRVGDGYLRGVISLLEREGVGAVTCPYHGLAVDSLWARLSALGIDTHFLPGVATGIGLGMGHPCMGSTIAFRRETLDRFGGLEGLADELADDHVIGARVRALGLAVVVTPFTIGHVCQERSLGDLVAQKLRWVRTIRQVEPGGHLGSLITHPVAFAALAVALVPGTWTGTILALALAARLGLCIAVERAFARPRHPYWLIPVRDLLSFAIYAASFLGRAVSWRGQRYDVARSGELLPKMTREPS